MIKHPNTLAGIIALLVFCGIFLQFILMIQAPTSNSIFEVIIRFFSYFTILSNLIVFAYFISKALSAELGENGFWTKPETSTAKKDLATSTDTKTASGQSLSNLAPTELEGVYGYVDWAAGRSPLRAPGA